MSGFILKERAQSEIPTPATGKATVFIDSLDGFPKYKDDAGTVHVFPPTTAEDVQDAIGSMLTDSSTLDFTYDDAGGTLTAIVKNGSISVGMLDFDVATQAELNAGITTAEARANHTGTQTASTISDFTEAAQDAVGGSLADTGTVDFTYNDGANTISAAVITTGLDLATTSLRGLIAASDRTYLNGMLGRIFLPESYGTLTAGSASGTVSSGQATANRQAIQAAISAASTAGGGWVLLPAGNFHIDTTITVPSGVHLVGMGRQGNTDVAGLAQTAYGTTLFWNSGASASPMVSASATQGVGNPALKGASVEHLNLQCAGGAATGLQIKSAAGCQFNDIYIINPTSRGVSCECFVKTTELGEAADNRIKLQNISVRALDGVTNVTSFYFGGSINANTSNSFFENLTCIQATGVGFDFANSDSNRAINLVCNIPDGGTAVPLYFRAAATSGQESRGNTVIGLSPGGSSTSTTRFAVCEGTNIAAAPSKNNSLLEYSTENGESYPKLGTGATLAQLTVAGGTYTPYRPTLTNDTVATTETVVASFTLPPNFLSAGANFNLRLQGQVSSTATLTFRVRIGAAGSSADALIAAFPTSAAGVANNFVQGDLQLFCLTDGATGTVSGNGVIKFQAADLVPAAAAFAAASVDTTQQRILTVTLVQSAAQTYTSRAASLTRIN